MLILTDTIEFAFSVSGLIPVTFMADVTPVVLLSGIETCCVLVNTADWFCVPPELAVEVNCTVSPGQFTVEGLDEAVILICRTLTVTGEDVPTEVPQFEETVYVPDVDTTID
jgi:hypothetical protein